MWFDAQTAGLIGGILGGAMGICGGIIGIMGGVFGREGKYKKIILAFTIAPLIVSVLMLPVGLTAIILRQPYHV